MARIVLEARALSTLGGGVRTYTKEVIVRLLAEPRGDEFHVVYDARKFAGTFPGAREHVVPVGHPLLRPLWDGVLLPFTVKRLRPDLVHYFKPAVSPLLTTRSVATLYDIIPLLFPYTQTPAQRWYWRVQLPLVARTCDHLLTISESSKRDIVRHLQVSPERVTVTRLGVSDRFRPSPPATIAEARRALRLPERFLLYVGTIEPRKNVARLLRAFARVSSRIPHDIVIAGKWGWLYEDVKRAAADSRIRSRVHMLSYVPDEFLPALYSAADIFAFPSLYEGFGLPPLEAMACGTPVITSNVSSLPEAVGPHALLVPPEDEEALAAAIERLLGDRALREKLRADGMAWARQFTWERTARETRAVYDWLLAGADGTHLA